MNKMPIFQKFNFRALTLHWPTYVYIQQNFSQTFWLFSPPSKKNSETNDTSLESPNKELLETEMKLGVLVF